MGERKPADIGFESWVDKQIREATERGEFDNLPGAGKPLPGLNAHMPYDELWWVKQKLREENVSALPPTLALRKQAQEARTAAARAGSEAEVREIVAEINDKIREAIKNPVAGPPLNLAPFDVERLVAQWRADHPGQD
ncbi:DUF1992 domain-containing protein [Saccharopolyspora erythraea]|uniref:DnaJ family domain-containing protein n=1 Tax=Saccharopolyspora erythraea TaxID=1836 RepID=UPI001BAB7CDA|nr:DUF1992 domain-containing protein [Saccharopolyspora erythraea]QUH02930.1 DUF1992 domain-containing protein [Saccharopolyspora erythraea]